MAAELALAPEPARSQLLERLRPRLGELIPGWRPVAEGILGDDARIDFVGVEPTGRLVLVFVGENDNDLALIGRALAQCAWVAARVPDWLQLAPQLGIRPAGGVRALLLCTRFGSEARSAANAVGRDQIALAGYRCFQSGDRLEIVLEPHHGAAPTPPAILAPSPASAARRAPEADLPPLPPFRTGLTESDLDPGVDEPVDLAPR